MAYQQIKSIRFYLNYTEWAMNLMPSLFEDDNNELFMTIPVKPIDVGVDAVSWPFDIAYEPSTFVPLSNQYVAILGHNVQYFTIKDYLGATVYATDLVNGTPEFYHGFSIFTHPSPAMPSNFTAENLYEQTPMCGSVVSGAFYDLTAPDLSLSINYLYGTSKEHKTFNGSRITNSMANKQPQWGNLGPFELSHPSYGSNQGLQRLSRSGRRQFKIRFSYLTDRSLWGGNQMLSSHSSHSYSELSDLGYTILDVNLLTGQFNANLLTGDNFFSQVWQKSLAGTIPMILQIENTNFNSDSFSIVRIKENSLKAKQTSFNTYSISLTLEEVF